MAKSPKGPGDRKSSSAKAGKRHGTVTYPAPLSSERRAAKEQGEQQFVAKATQTVVLEREVLEWDKALRGAVLRTKKVTVPTEHIWDANRGRVIVSPRFKEVDEPKKKGRK